MGTWEAETAGHRLKAALALRGWTVIELAAALAHLPDEYKLSKSTLDRISRGAREPYDWQYEPIAEALNVPERFLRYGFDDPPPSSTIGTLERIEEKLDRALSAAGVALAAPPAGGSVDRLPPPRRGGARDVPS